MPPILQQLAPRKLSHDAVVGIGLWFGIPCAIGLAIILIYCGCPSLSKLYKSASARAKSAAEARAAEKERQKKIREDKAIKAARAAKKARKERKAARRAEQDRLQRIREAQTEAVQK